MLDYLIYFVAFLITFPFVLTFAAYFLFRKVYGHQWKAIHSTVGWTTIGYVAAVPLLFKVLFGHSFIGIVLLLLLIILAIIIYFQWKVHVEVEIKQAIKILWRICFLLFLFLYIVLVFFGIIGWIFY